MDKPTSLCLSCCPAYPLWPSHHLLLHRLLIWRRLTDMAPPPKLTLSLWQPRRKLQLLLLNPPLHSFGFFNLSCFGGALFSCRSVEGKMEVCVSWTVDGCCCSWIHLMHNKELFELDFQCRRITRLWSKWERLCPEVYPRSRVGLKHSQMEATAHWAPQQKIDSFFLNLILLFTLYLSSSIQYPGYWASKRLWCKQLSFTFMCFILASSHNTWLHGWLFVCYIHQRAVDGVMQRLCFPFAHITSCLPTFTLCQSRWD